MILAGMIDLVVRGVQLSPDALLRRFVDRRLQTQLHPGERRPQLVRCVATAVLRLTVFFHAVRHLVEAADDLDLRRATGVPFAETRTLRSPLPGSGTRGEPYERTRQGLRDAECEEQAGRKARDPKRDEPQGCTADRVLDPREALRDPGGPHELRATGRAVDLLDDRRGRGHDVLPEGLAVPHLRVRLRRRTQRPQDLRARVSHSPCKVPELLMPP